MAFIFKVLSKDALTNSGVISSPFWNFTFSRIWNFHVVGSTFSHLSASCPLNSILSVTVTNVSPAPIRTIVQPSHSCAGSMDSPNQYRPKFKCLAAPEADFSFPPHPVNTAVINRQQKITYRIFSFYPPIGCTKRKTMHKVFLLSPVLGKQYFKIIISLRID